MSVRKWSSLASPRSPFHPFEPCLPADSQILRPAHILCIALWCFLERILEPAFLAVNHGEPRLINQRITDIERPRLVFWHLVPKQLVVRRFDRLSIAFVFVVVDEQTECLDYGGGKYESGSAR